MSVGKAVVNLYQSSSGNKLINTFGLMILFFMLFDGIITYLIPLVILEHGLTKTMLGVIMATAAVSGAFFDFTIYKIFREAFYRRLFTVMFAVAGVYLFIVWSANSILLYVAAMAMWGFYYDLKNFATLDFVSRYSTKKELSSNFGILQVFQSVGYLLAPLIAGFVIIETVGWEPFIIAALFLSISAFFFAILVLEARKRRQFVPDKETRAKNIFEEILGWKTVGSSILPVLVLAAFSTMHDSFFMAIGPILAETLPVEPFDGLFMVAYFLPQLIVGGFVGTITKRFGEKETALLGLLIGASILSTMSLFESPLLIILVVFASACFTCVMNPVLQSIYARCIQETPKAKKEVQELGDLFSNGGYIIGPIIAGIIADNFGNISAFSILGGSGVAFALMLFLLMPKKTGVTRKSAAT